MKNRTKKRRQLIGGVLDVPTSWIPNNGNTIINSINKKIKEIETSHGYTTIENLPPSWKIPKKLISEYLKHMIPNNTVTSISASAGGVPIHNADTAAIINVVANIVASKTKADAKADANIVEALVKTKADAKADTNRVAAKTEAEAKAKTEAEAKAKTEAEEKLYNSKRTNILKQREENAKQRNLNATAKALNPTQLTPGQQGQIERKKQLEKTRKNYQKKKKEEEERKKKIK